LKARTRQHLKTFLEKADKLKSFAFEAHVKRVGFGWRTYRGEHGGHVVEFDLPDEKERDAFLLTFRLFIQQNEPISFHRLDSIGNDPGISGALKEKLLESRGDFFEYLDGYPAYISDLFGPQPTRGEILKVVLYGHLAHTKDKRRYKEWARDDIRESILLQAFTQITLVLLFMIYAVAESIRSELDRSEAAGSDTV
jgi:hypothetical protein